MLRVVGASSGGRPALLFRWRERVGGRVLVVGMGGRLCPVGGRADRLLGVRRSGGGLSVVGPAEDLPGWVWRLVKYGLNM